MFNELYPGESGEVKHEVKKEKSTEAKTEDKKEADADQIDSTQDAKPKKSVKFGKNKAKEGLINIYK